MISLVCSTVYILTVLCSNEVEPQNVCFVQILIDIKMRRKCSVILDTNWRVLIFFHGWINISLT